MLKRMTAYWWDKDKNAVAISYKDNRLILTVDDAQELLRQLEMLLPERPSRDEPEEPGFYRTRTGAFLRKNENGAWSACSSMATSFHAIGTIRMITRSGGRFLTACIRVRSRLHQPLRHIR